MQSQDYPYAKNEYKLVIAIYRTRMTILMQEMNAIADSHLSHENCQEAERIQRINDHFSMREECKLLQSNSHTRTTKEAEEMIEKRRRKRRIIFSAQMSNLGTQCRHSDILNSSIVFEATKDVTIPSWSLDRGLSACQVPM